MTCHIDEVLIAKHMAFVAEKPPKFHYLPMEFTEDIEIAGQSSETVQQAIQLDHADRSWVTFLGSQRIEPGGHGAIVMDDVVVTDPVQESTDQDVAWVAHWEDTLVERRTKPVDVVRADVLKQDLGDESAAIVAATDRTEVLRLEEQIHGTGDAARDRCADGHGPALAKAQHKVAQVRHRARQGNTAMTQAGVPGRHQIDG